MTGALLTPLTFSPGQKVLCLREVLAKTGGSGGGVEKVAKFIFIIKLYFPAKT